MLAQKRLVNDGDADAPAVNPRLVQSAHTQSGILAFLQQTGRIEPRRQSLGTGPHRQAVKGQAAELLEMCAQIQFGQGNVCQPPK